MIVSRHLLQKSDRTLRRFQTPKPGSWKIWEGCLWKPVWRKFSECYRTPTCLNGRFPAPLCTMASKHPNSSSFRDHDFQPGLWWVALNRAEGPWLCWTKKKIKDSLNDKNDWNGGISCTRGPPVACIGPHPAKKKRGERVRLYGFTTDYAPTTWDPTASVVARRGGNQPATLADLTNSDF